ncbi:MAG: DUF5320 domain-containing protein [bacterium]
MPRGDKTGPDGMGPMTGRAMGFCNGFNTPGFMRGFGFGRGGGRGFGRGIGFQGRGRRGIGYAVPYFMPQQIDVADSKEALNEEIASVEKYLSELKEMVQKKKSEK